MNKSIEEGDVNAQWELDNPVGEVRYGRAVVM